MLSDELTLAALREKLARLNALGDISTTAMYALYLAEIPRLMKWIVGVPMLKAFVEEIRTMHDDEERELRAVLVADAKEMATVAAPFRSECPTKSEREADEPWPEPTDWSLFDGAVTSLDTEPTAPETVDEMLRDAGVAAEVLHKHAQAAFHEALRARNRTRERIRVARLLLDRGPPARDESGPLHQEFENAIAEEPTTERQHQIVDQLTAPIFSVVGRCKHEIQAWGLVQETSPSASLARLIGICRAQHPPLGRVTHWTDAVMKSTSDETARSLAHLEAGRVREKPAEVYSEARVHLGRFVEELLVLGGSGLSSQIVVSRFKERCIHYDKPRLREVARRKGSGGSERKGDGMREDRLTFELAKYLHDNGIFVFVRLRMSNLEPDAVGIRRLAVESKAYASAKSARADVVDGYYQLHSYLSSLETDAMRVGEGFLVIFRLDDGPIYDTPPTMYLGRFRIHSLTIDIATSKTSGRKQPKTVIITEEEILGAIEKGGANAPPKKRAKSPSSTRRQRR